MLITVIGAGEDNTTVSMVWIDLILKLIISPKIEEYYMTSNINILTSVRTGGLRFLLMLTVCFCFTVAARSEQPEAIASIGYTGSPGKVVHAHKDIRDNTNGVFVAGTYSMPVYKGFTFRPEVALGGRRVTFEEEWTIDLSLRALGTYSINVSKTKLGVFTGPRMDIKLFDVLQQWDSVLPGHETKHPYYSRVNAYWMFGVFADIEMIEVRVNYSLPFTNYEKYPLGGGRKLNIFEASIGYRFKVGR